MTSATDMDMKWTFLNNAATEPLGITRQSVLGMACNTWGANICQTPDCGIECLRKNKSKTHFHQWNKDFEVETTYLYSKSGNKIGHIEVVDDITDKLALSKILKRAEGLPDILRTGSTRVNAVSSDLLTASETLKDTSQAISQSLSNIEQQATTNADRVVAVRHTASALSERAEAINEAITSARLIDATQGISIVLDDVNNLGSTQTNPTENDVIVKVAV